MNQTALLIRTTAAFVRLLLTCLHDCPHPMASPRPRLVYSRTGIEPANHDTDTAVTMSIDGLFHLSVEDNEAVDVELMDDTCH